MYDEYFTGSALYLAIYIAFYFNWSHVSSLAFDLVFVFSLHLSFVLPRLSSVLLYSSFCHDFHLSLTLSFALFHCCCVVCLLLSLIWFFLFPSLSLILPLVTSLFFCLASSLSLYLTVISYLALPPANSSAQFFTKSIALSYHLSLPLLLCNRIQSKL